MIATLAEICLWCHTGNKLYNQCQAEIMVSQTESSANPYSVWRFGPMFQDVSTPVEEKPITDVIMQALKIILASYRSSNENEILVYSKEIKSIFGSVQSDNFTPTLSVLISHLRERSQDLFAHILSLLTCEQDFFIKNIPDIKPENTNKGLTPTRQQIFNILMKVLGTKHCDCILSVSLLTLLTKKESLKVLNELVRKFGYDYIKLQNVAKIGYDFCTLHLLIEVKDQFSVLLNKAVWGKRLSDFNISFKEAFKGDPTALMDVLKLLVAHPNCSFSVLYDFCSDFNLDLTNTLFCYLKFSIYSWSPEPIKGSNETDINISKPPATLIPKCQSIISKFEDKDKLSQALTSELEEISCYNYEMLQIVIDQLIALVHNDDQSLEKLCRGQDILKFLSLYIRKQPPQDTEKDSWAQNYPSTQLPEIAKYRLPFHDLFNKNKIMKLIEAEIDDSNIDIWVNAPASLSLNQDQLCFIATQNTVTRSLDNQKSLSGNTTIPWQICSQNSTLLTKLELIVKQIRHDELATACTNWVVNRLPPGIDKVVSAEKCALLALKWQNNSGGSKASDAYEKFMSRYHQLAIEHVLHKYSLATPSYIAMAKDPIKLILALYNHTSLSNFATLATQSVPDINQCVSEISDIANMNQVNR